MEVVASEGTTVVVSSHVLSDLERVCDFVIILSSSRVQVAQDIEELLASHKILIGVDSAAAWSSANGAVIRSSQTDRQTTLLVRGSTHVFDPRWDVRHPTLEEIVLAYLENSQPAHPSASNLWRPRDLGQLASVPPPRCRGTCCARRGGCGLVGDRSTPCSRLRLDRRSM
jgi:ABC-2 type transport system ATP-binding protein